MKKTLLFSLTILLAIRLAAQGFAYRGMHLDCSRHFFSTAVVKRYIDELAKNNINYFHWHLTDDQGWRLEIKQYPALTTTGAWRTEKDGTLYGGFYTQDEVKEIVSYAAAKQITVVPEIDLPGHSTAAIAAYPFLSCHGEPVQVSSHWGIHRDIICPTDSAIQFFKNVLDEVCTLFPSHYIHIGGDEVPKTQWKASPKVSLLMQQKQLKNYEQVQHYFMKQLENYLLTKGRRSIMWGEAIRGGINDSTLVMSWRGKATGIKAARQGNQVIMAPRFSCYFDYPQSIKDKKYAWWMTYLPAKKVARFNPYAKSLSQVQNQFIIGGEATLWTEYVTSETELFHQLLPRLEELGKVLSDSTKVKN